MPTIEEVKALPKEEKEQLFNALKEELETKEEVVVEEETVKEEKEVVEENDNENNEEETLEGGKADNMSVEDIAKKHNVEPDVIKTELEKAILVELEHTNDRDVAREIAMDHLSEQADYYEKLAVVEDTKEEPTNYDKKFQEIEKSFDEKLAKALEAYDKRFADNQALLEKTQAENEELKRTQPFGNVNPKPSDVDSLKAAEKRDELARKYKERNNKQTVV